MYESPPLSLEVPRSFPWKSLLEFFSARAIPGVEWIEGGLERTVTVEGARGHLTVEQAEATTLRVQFLLNQSVDLADAVETVGHMFDIGADVAAVEAALSRDKRLAATIARNPGLRVPGTWDAFELCVRAIVGQQITVSGARTLLGRLCEQVGARQPAEDRHCNRWFPTAVEIVEADLSRIGLTGARAKTLKAFAETVASGNLILDDKDTEACMNGLLAIRGIGPWTVNYIAMRALRNADAFPSGDSGLLAAARSLGIADTQKEVSEAAEAWRPWRAYAAMHLWRSLATDHSTS